MAYGAYPTYGSNYQGIGYFSPQAQGLQSIQQMQMPQQTIQPAPQPQAAPTNGLNWIEGAEAAKAYIVAPNCTVVLFDTKNPIMYIKSADLSGMPSTRTFRIEEIGENLPNVPSKDVPGVSREEMQEFESRIEKLEKQIQSLSAAKPKGKVKEAAEDEPTV